MAEKFHLLVLSTGDEPEWSEAVCSAARSAGGRPTLLPLADHPAPVSWQNYDLILLEAGPSVVELLHAIRAGHPAARLVVASASPSVEEAVEVMRAGALHYMPKTTHLPANLAAIERNRARAAAPEPSFLCQSASVKTCLMGESQ